MESDALCPVFTQLLFLAGKQWCCTWTEISNVANLTPNYQKVKQTEQLITFRVNAQSPTTFISLIYKVSPIQIIPKCASVTFTYWQLHITRWVMNMCTNSTTDPNQCIHGHSVGLLKRTPPSVPLKIQLHGLESFQSRCLYRSFSFRLRQLYVSMYTRPFSAHQLFHTTFSVKHLKKFFSRWSIAPFNYDRLTDKRAAVMT